MYPYMLTISFMLHLFAFFWIFLLSMRLKRTNEIEKRQAEIQKEIEDLFQSYLLEMKEENEKLLNLINKPKQQPTITPTLTKSPVIKREKETQQQIHQYQEKPKQKEYLPPMPTGEDRFEQSLNSKVVLLHEQGFKTEEIAQKLNKGKTEIELILKFNGSKG